MSKMSKSSSLLVAYLPTLRTFVHRLRATSASPSSLSSTLLSSKVTPHHELTLVDSTTDTSLGPEQPLRWPIGLGLQPGLVLPGTVGVPESLRYHKELNEEQQLLENEACELTSATTENDEAALRTVECKLQECPEFIHDEMMQLFPEVEVGKGELRLIILTEKTINDMTSWSPAVEDEREELLAHFIDSAKEVCSRLMAAGYWSDFIDPSSGRAFYGCHTHNTLFETDDKFRYLGFEIQDLGCCKCIMHPVWASYTFVGTIFTNSPINSPVIQEIINL